MKIIHTHDAIRSNLNKRIRPEIRPRPPLEELRQTEWLPEFERYMRNRLIMGALRYETFAEKMKGNKYKCIEYIIRKCDEYEKTGNLECLVDLANVAMIEFGSPHHPNPHFTPGDDTSHVGTFNDTL
jgi:hypothetical protein